MYMSANRRAGWLSNVGASDAPDYVGCDHCGLGKDLKKEDHP
jgi:hypothetical protein